MFKVTTVEFTGDPNEALKDVLASMDKELQEWTLKAARGECGWICSDCCSSDSTGMPDECMHGQQWCTDIIQRDKSEATKNWNKDETPNR